MPAITQGVIDFALSPPLGVLKNHLDLNGPYGPGNVTLTTWNNSGVTMPVNDTFGVWINFYGPIPQERGLDLGWDDLANIQVNEYKQRLLQLVVVHTLLGGGPVVSQVEDIFYLPITIRWREALPGTIGLYVSPNMQVDLQYLLVG